MTDTSGLLDRDFLRLKPVEANNVALGRAPEECARLRQLYRAEHGIDIESWKSAPASSSDGVQNWGGWLMLLGIAGGIGSFFFPVGVEPVGLYGVDDRIANIDLIALRHMCLATALGLFVAGAVLFGAGHIAKAIRVGKTTSA